MGAIKELILSKLSVRIVYTLANVGSSYALSILAKTPTQALLKNIFVDPRLQPSTKDWLQPILMGGILVAGEWTLDVLHKKNVLPNIDVKK
jgi:hypothetical protein